MKKVHNSLLWAIVGLFALAFSPAIYAQDDLYYDPATDAPASVPAASTEEYDENNNVTRRYNDDDDDYYDDEDDYAYEYSSRIRRFQRRSVVVDYYDPFFVDLYNYDPFYSPGTTIYVQNYNDYWSYRRWQRWNRWNSWNSGWGGGWGAGWNSWGWNSAYSYNTPWYNPWVVNNYYYDPYWTCNGYNPYYQNQYYGNGWVNNHYYYNNNNGNGGGDGYSPQTYTGPRRNGSSVNPGYARIPDSKGRLATSQTNVPMVQKSTPRPGRTAGDIESNSAVGRGKTATDRTATPDPIGRRPEGSTTKPAGRTNNPEAAPTGRDVEKPSPRKEEGYKPRRTEDTPSPRKQEGYKPRPTEDTPSRPQRTETPSRRNGNEDGTISTPRRSEPTPSRREESRPARRTEERSYERPNRSNNNGSNGSSQESRPSRTFDGGSSTRSSSGSSTRSSDSGSSKSSSGSNSSKSRGRGGRN